MTRGTTQPAGKTRPPTFSPAARWLLLLASVFSATELPAQTPRAAARAAAHAAAQTNAAPWADFVEPDAPFFSSVLDARKLGAGLPADNLTPRGLILNLGHDCWACFDTDLLRVAAVWHGKPVSAVSMAQISYHVADSKTPGGQNRLPQPEGEPWLANGIYPGWQSSAEIALTDPRPPAPDVKEVGRGPLPPALGRFQAVRLTRGGLRLEYEVAGVVVREWVEARLHDGRPVVQRTFRLERAPAPLWLVLGRQPSVGATGLKLTVSSSLAGGRALAALVPQPDGLLAVRVERHDQPVEFSVAMGWGGPVRTWEIARGAESDLPPPTRWPAVVKTGVKPSRANEAYVFDHIAPPTTNPWRRNVRLADLAFLPDGRAVAVTFDGDVWSISGLGRDAGEVEWRRFATGLHEPLGLCVRGTDVFVFDRNGIWRLRDTDGNGEADVHELFSNAFAQTAETREFAAGLRPAPDGSFVIAKGGIQSSTLGRHNGSVLRVAADGRSASVLGWGLREPFIGVHPRTGMVTASDQQGHYVPATPLHIIRDNQFYGFLSNLLPTEQYPAPIAEPLTWIPHPINASGVSQAWLTGARMGPLNDALIHFGYYRPELFLVLLNQRTTRPQAAVLSLARLPEFAPLNGAVNPADGQLYIVGFQIWGTAAKQVTGLARLRYTGVPSTLPREVVPMDQGILLRFDTPLAAASAANPANFSVERWNYVRTSNYGSPHLKLDGQPGQEWLPPSSAYLSQDGRSVFVGVPGMKPAMQMRIGWALAARDGTAIERNAYFTPYELVRFDPVAEGFGTLQVDLTPRVGSAAAATPVTVEEGRRVAELMGCVACHSTDGSTLGKVGPSWKGLFGSERLLKDGGKALADEAYLRESILEPTAKIVRGFEKSDTGMPSYAGVITAAQVEALILHLKALR